MAFRKVDDQHYYDVARAFLSGASLEELAERYGRAASTIRNHIAKGVERELEKAWDGNRFMVRALREAADEGMIYSYLLMSSISWHTGFGRIRKWRNVLCYYFDGSLEWDEVTRWEYMVIKSAKWLEQKNRSGLDWLIERMNTKYGPKGWEIVSILENEEPHSNWDNRYWKIILKKKRSI